MSAVEQTENSTRHCLIVSDVDAEIAAEMDATIDFTIASAEPPLASMFRDVYDPTEPEPEPVRTRIDRVLARE